MEERKVAPADPTCYEEFSQAHSVRVRQLCRLLLAHPHEAEDVAQEVFVLRHLEGWSLEEIAEALELSPGSVKRHLFRAVHHLRKAPGGHL